jgi:WD40 repeat protein
MSSDENSLFASTIKGSLFQYNFKKSCEIVCNYKGSKGSISHIALDQEDKYLASASLDRYVRIY